MEECSPKRLNHLQKQLLILSKISTTSSDVAEYTNYINNKTKLLFCNYYYFFILLLLSWTFQVLILFTLSQTIYKQMYSPITPRVRTHVSVVVLFTNHRLLLGPTVTVNSRNVRCWKISLIEIYLFEVPIHISWNNSVHCVNLTIIIIQFVHCFIFTVLL